MIHPPREENKMSKQDYSALYARAHEAGMAAGEAACPAPMHVVQRANPFDDNSPVVKRYAPIMDGVCGFAWINVPGNSGFARWARENNLGYRDYYRGFNINVRKFGQSYERKLAYARAFAGVLVEAGIERAYASGRLD